MIRTTKDGRSRLVAGISAGMPAVILVPVITLLVGYAASASLAAPRTPHVRPTAGDPGRPAREQPPGVPTTRRGAAPGTPSGPVSAAASGSRQVTFINRVGQTIWVAASPDPSHPMARTGWVLRPGHEVTVTVPNHWNGRFWGRTGCVFHDGRGSCQTGDCSGKFQCSGSGTIPATLAEYALDAWDNLDFYDVSMVDGSNLPMYVYPTSGQAAQKVSRNGCVPAGCTTPVHCPSVLQIDYRGKYVACESACAKLGGDQYCCRGKWAPQSMCIPPMWPVDYARVFKTAEPYAYSYADDDATSVYVCKGRCNYNIVFGITPRR